MRNPAGRLRVAIATALLVMGLMIGPAVASAALSVTGVTLDGATSVSSPPGGVMPARVTTKITSPTTTWSSTRERTGAQARCVSHGKATGTGSHSTTFNLTAPGDPGDYDAGFTAASGANCSGTQSPEKVLQEAIRVTTPAPNPNLAPVCGIDVMLVLDESGSIATTGATETVREAARGFLDALAGTGSAVSIVDFSTSAAQPVPYTTVTASSIDSVFAPYLKNGYKPSGWTNWEAAFQKVRQANAVVGGTKADLVLFITDGDPTAYNRAGGSPVTGVVEGDVTALRRAAAEADAVKEQGSHVLALGVGAAVTSANSERRLTAISGFDQYPEPEADFGKADYALVKDTEDLPAALRAFAVALCKGSLAVTKLVDEGDGVFRPDPGWNITATVATSSGGYTWTQPPPPTPPGPRTVPTDKDGVANFQWAPDDATASSLVSVTEESRPGYDLVDWTCTKGVPGRTRVRTTRGAAARIATGTLGPNEYARCTVRNRIQPGTIEIEKSASPQGSQGFDFVGSGPLGSFTLVDDGKTGPASRIFTGLVPGTYTVREVLPAKWELSGVTCSDPSVVISGAQVTIALAPGGSVVCTYRDRQLDPPVPPPPPEPPVPPTPPPNPPPPPPPPPPVVIASTQLSVTKSTPRRARVGARVPFRLSVTNTGPLTATDVLLADVPPAAMSLTGLRSSGARLLRVVRGNAVWTIGTLAPGQTRTVRGSVVLTSSTLGIVRNTAIATASNAGVAVRQADVRVLAARTIRPAVTG